MPRQLKMLKNRSWLILLTPAAVLLTSLLFRWAEAPVYAGPRGFDYDPSYVYLLSGLQILNGIEPTHVDHPGTPLQILCASLIFVQWGFEFLLGSEFSINQAVIDHPESYLRTTAITLAFLVSLGTYVLGRSIYNHTGQFALVVFVQLSPLIYHAVLPWLGCVAPEALLVFWVLILLTLLTPKIFGPPPVDLAANRWREVAIGCVFGLGVTTKVTFLPLVFLPLVLLFRADGRFSLYRIAGGVIGTLVLTLSVIWGRLSYVQNWLGKIAMNSGRYGTGRPQMIEPALFSQNLETLIRSFPVFFALAIVLAWFAHAGFKNHSGAKRWFLPAALCVVCLQTALVAKHPGAHYMIPALPVAIYATAWSIEEFRLPSNVRIAACVLAALLALRSASGAIQIQSMKNENLAAVDRFRTKMSSHPSSLLLIGFRALFPEYALHFATGYAREFSTAVAKRFPDALPFNVWAQKVRHPVLGWLDNDTFNQQINSGRPIFLIGSKGMRNEAFRVEKVDESNKMELFRVLGAK